MPELPEVESVRRALTPGLVGRRIVRVSLRRADVVRGPRERPALLGGSRITALARRGKQLAIIAENGRVLVVHLGMSGQLMLVRAAANPARADHVHCVWTLDSGDRVVFRDPRRFGGLWTLANDAALLARWGRLGPDALDSEGLRSALVRARASRRAIKACLLDQRTVAGIGNIYADEALFAAGVRPMRPATTLDQHETGTLARAIPEIMTKALRAGGSTLRDFADGLGQRGSYQREHAVYGRGGEDCVRCGKPLRRSVLVQRATVWCDSCQR